RGRCASGRGGPTERGSAQLVTVPAVEARVLSIQVGVPRTIGRAGAEDPMDREWTSAFVKEPVEGAVWLGFTNLAGDRQADRRNHGGPDKAVLAYAAAHYPRWQAELGRSDIGFGGFGENLTVSGFAEDVVCVGDVMTLGDAVLELSQPRGPCWKIARRWRIPDLTARVLRSGRTGWYYRVRREGSITAGLPLAIVERPHPEWPVSRALEVMYVRRHDIEGAAALAECEALSAGWRDKLRERVAAAGGGG
ncbi:MAG TPA: MOSC domain-containing protein, partial [Gemmatimonadaceae bacterium]|nr:MOSC domain-containing protein [Gemmatimonadaceae bacterium]